MLTPAAIDWQPPDERFDALIFTSPQAPTLAGAAAKRYRALPAFAVGARTAAAAREAGFVAVSEAGGHLHALYDAVVATGHRRLLHLAGAHRTEAPVPDELEIVVRAVYEARLAPFDADAAAKLRQGAIDWALLFSTRSAGHFASLFDALTAERGTLAVAAISAVALAATGTGWRRAVAAEVPTEAGILAASGLSCDKSALPGQRNV